MRRKDMEPGVLYAIRSNGMWRPGYVFDATHAESIRVRVYWTWPPPNFIDDGSTDYRETDYLDPAPDLLSPLAKFDDKRVKTNDVIQTWESWAIAQRTDRDNRLQARLDEEAQEAADKAAAIASNTARVEALRDLLSDDASAYPGIKTLLSDVTYGWTQSRYSANDVVTLLEQAVRKMTAA